MDVAGVDSFLFAPLDGVLKEEHVANFATTTPLPMKMPTTYVARSAPSSSTRRACFSA